MKKVFLILIAISIVSCNFYYPEEEYDDVYADCTVYHYKNSDNRYVVVAKFPGDSSMAASLNSSDSVTRYDENSTTVTGTYDDLWDVKLKISREYINVYFLDRPLIYSYDKDLKNEFWELGDRTFTIDFDSRHYNDYLGLLITNNEVAGRMEEKYSNVSSYTLFWDFVDKYKKVETPTDLNLYLFSTAYIDQGNVELYLTTCQLKSETIRFGGVK